MRRDMRRFKGYRTYEDSLFRVAGVLIILALLWRLLEWLLG